MLTKKMLLLVVKSVKLVEVVLFRLSSLLTNLFLVEAVRLAVVACIRHCSQQTRSDLEDLFG